MLRGQLDDNGACLIIVSKESKKRRVRCHNYPAVKVVAPQVERTSFREPL